MSDAATISTEDPVRATRGIDLLLGFVNTIDAESGSDALTTRPELTAYLVSTGLLGRPIPAQPDDVELARLLRTGLRTALEHNHDGIREGSPLLDEAGSRLPLRVGWRDGRPALSPVDTGVRGGLAEILVAVNESVADETWSRLKLCPAGDCLWAYVDESKNRSRNWCGTGCSNRAKTRAYRARQKNKESASATEGAQQRALDV